ncbi:uncharacterized protein L969DRAFT_606130 [Mixia osmundae IAM 14324]|uniref:HECT-type E3 ubiquitin transferase n=1 Tax=Mixia osmundae (strain CBS 9802 / IAM 14324 / JCM 22182 / KY 12970) TaxID=764103 RepID=G7E0C5_MIXOS|nr:uncharacterized protein L969DRAFT_606130 [Mixia osmundae IAM 14324]KEI42277.1 hypothetical protein L969DRAFT_606130 [Mixia osmundae IAM 14324]GAA96285.1 hypothetical protein E5Q_02951 [Mixia osmundae IAM 14324]
MGKIKKPQKRSSVAPQPVTDLIEKLTSAPDHELAAVLSAVKEWTWPRTDLQCWVNPLNRFDGLLETIIKDYSLHSDVQLNEFTPKTLALVQGILSFERLLLEHATNRKLFASWDRLDDLFHTSDLSVLELTLRLALKAAQTSNNSPASSLSPRSHGLTVSRLLALAQSWNGALVLETDEVTMQVSGEASDAPLAEDEKSWSMIDYLSAAHKSESGETCMLHLQSLAFEFYKRSEVTEHALAVVQPSFVSTMTPRKATDAALATPISSKVKSKATPASGSKGQGETPNRSDHHAANWEGLLTISIDRDRLTDASKSDVDVVADCADEHKLSPEHKLDLLQRVRLARAFQSSGDRQRIIILRLLCIALAAQTFDDATSQTSLFVSDPELVRQTAELLLPDQDIDIEIRAAALHALDACLRIRARQNEVTSSVNVTVNHGLLMNVLRSTVADLASDSPQSSREFIEALFNFMSDLQCLTAAGNALVAAGLIGLLVELLRNRTESSSDVAVKAVIMLDGATYSYPSATTAFFAAQGVTVLVDRVAEMVDQAVQANMSTDGESPLADLTFGKLPLPTFTLLKTICRSILRMMQTVGAAEGLRNLIDSSLLQSIRKILEQRRTFGPAIYSVAINLMATFVHNEPTSLAILQENKLPLAFYDAIDSGLEASSDVMAAVPSAIGALCLNEAGLSDFEQRGLLPVIFRVFLRSEHVKVLNERDNASMFGATIDELVRHHPSLQPKVITCIVQILDALTAQTKDAYLEKLRLLCGRENVQDLADAFGGYGDQVVEADCDRWFASVDAVARFLESLCQTSKFAATLTAAGAIHTILKLYRHPKLPLSLGMTTGQASGSASAALLALMKLLCELCASQALSALVDALQTVLAALRTFWTTDRAEEPQYKSSANEPIPAWISLDSTAHPFVSARALAGLASSVMPHITYDTRTTQQSVAETLLAAGTFLSDFGQFRRAAIWESFALQSHRTAGSGAAPETESSQSDLQVANMSAVDSVAASGSIADADATSASTTLNAQAIGLPASAATDKSDRNLLRHVLIDTATHIQGFFENVAGRIPSRRALDSQQRRSTEELAATLAQIASEDLNCTSIASCSPWLPYSILVTKSVVGLLSRERSVTYAECSLAVLFERKAGVQRLIALFRQYIDEVSTITAKSAADHSPLQSVRLYQLAGAMSVAMEFASKLATLPKPLESLMRTAAKDEQSKVQAFIVSVRASLLPIADEMWNATWLRPASSPSNVRTLTQLMLTILAAKDESLDRAEPPQSLLTPVTGSSLGLRNRLQENRADGGRPDSLQQVVDMGFPRPAATLALARFNNNVIAATEFLLNNPETVARARDISDVGGSVLDEPPIALDSAGSAMRVDGTAVDAASPDTPTATLQRLLPGLNEQRTRVKETFIERTCDLAEAFPVILFDLSEAICSGIFSDDAPAWIHKVFDFTCKRLEEPDASADRVFTAFRLTAFLLHEKAVDPIALPDGMLASFMRMSVSYIRKADVKEMPIWTGPALLLLETLFCTAETAKQPSEAADADADDVSIIRSDVVIGPAYDEERLIAFDVCFKLLCRTDLSDDLLTSVLRLLVILTRHEPLAGKMATREALDALLHLKQKTLNRDASNEVLILRHSVESSKVLKQIGTGEIDRWITRQKGRSVDVTTYVKALSFFAFRDPVAFLQCTADRLMLTSPHSTMLKERLSEFPLADGKAASAPDLAAVVDEASDDRKLLPKANTNPSVSPETDIVVHTLMAELLRIVSELKSSFGDGKALPALHMPAAAPNQTPTSASTIPNAVAGSPLQGERPVDAAKAAQSSHAQFVIACLVELLYSYGPCKTSFVQFSRRKGAAPAAAPSLDDVPVTPAKPRSSFLNFLLHDLIPMDNITTVLANVDDLGLRKLPIGIVKISEWAPLLLVALCYDASVKDEGAEPSEEISAIRTLVLDCLARAILDASASDEPKSVRYARLCALADICHRLATPGPDDLRHNRRRDEMHTQMSKLMLDRDFVTILTNTLAELDLNFPAVQNLVNRILRPIQFLTRIVGKIARPTSDSSGVHQNVYGSARNRELGIPDSDSDDDVEGGQDQTMDETSDLYRNSALGMFDGELETGGQEDAPSTHSSQEEYDEDEDEAMDDYGLADDAINPSDVSDASDDEDDHRITSHDAEMMDADDIDEEVEDDGDDDDEDDDDDDSDDHDTESEHDDDGGDESDGDTDLDPEGYATGSDMDAGDERALQSMENAARQILGGEHGHDESGWPEDEEDGFTMRTHLRINEHGEPRLGEGRDGDQLELLAEVVNAHGQDSDIMAEISYEEDDEEEIDGDAVVGRSSHVPAPNWSNFPFLVEPRDNSPMTNGLQEPRIQQGQGTFNAGQHPLLVEPANTEQRRSGVNLRSSLDHPQDFARQLTRNYSRIGGDNAIDAISSAIGVNPMDILETLLGGRGHAHLPDLSHSTGEPGPHDIVLDFTTTGDGRLGPGASFPLHLGRRPVLSAPRPYGERGSSTIAAAQRNLAAQDPQLVPASTSMRWDQEADMLHGRLPAPQGSPNLVQQVLRILRPAARAAQATALASEKAKAEANDKVPAADEAAMSVTVDDRNADGADLSSAADPSAAEITAAPLRERVERSPATTRADEDLVAQSRNLADALGSFDFAASESAEVAAPETTQDADMTTSETAATVSSAPDAAVPASRDADQAAEVAAEPSSAPRVTIQINGATVDITETGIDPTFLEALPDDMRQEVLNQHFREVRPPPVPANVPSSISPEFLDALPVELREEVLRQEAQEAARRERIARGAANRPAGVPAEMDPASFIASLNDTHLREAVYEQLQDADQDFVASLPATMRAELEAVRARRPIAIPPGQPIGRRRIFSSTVKSTRKNSMAQSVQLLDRAGLATLARLLFLQQPLDKNVLYAVLQNICQHQQTRSDLIALLLGILQDGTDITAVDQSFSQMSIRSGKQANLRPPSKRRATGDAPIPLQLQQAQAPSARIVAAQCLDALALVSKTAEDSQYFFLTAQEASLFGKRSMKKLKGKEKAPASIYPLTILLALLSKPQMLRLASAMDRLLPLLAQVTKPLTSIKPNVKTAIEQSGRAAADAPHEATNTPASVAQTSTTSNAAEGAASTSTATEPDSSDGAHKAERSLNDTPPVIPPHTLKLVVNVLDASECSSKTFQHTLTLIQHLSHLPGAREVILSELASRAQHYEGLLWNELGEFSLALRDPSSTARTATLAKFSPASSTQAKLLRILKTIDYTLTVILGAAESTADTTGGLAVGAKAINRNAVSESEQLTIDSVHRGIRFEALWQRVGECLSAIEDRAELAHVTTVLLPSVEALMVVSRYILTDATQPLGVMTVMSPKVDTPGSSDGNDRAFIDFTRRHRKTLNTMVRNNPSLMAGSFAILVHNSKVLDFDNKRNYFNQKLHKRTNREHHHTLQINVRRPYVFEDSFSQLQRKTGEEIKHGKLSVRFYDEEGVDVGGVTREWFHVLARQMFNPGYALFEPCLGDRLTYHPRRTSSVVTDHLAFFKFVGRIIGKAVFDGRLLDAYFTRSLYKQMIGKPVSPSDLESIDPEYYKSLTWMLQNDITGVMDDYTFSIEEDVFGEMKIVELKPNGANINVTQENKHEYVRLVTEQRLTKSVQAQIDSFLAGLWEIIPKDLIQIFSDNELELLISGLPDIDVDEWRANTVYHNLPANSTTVTWFWRAVRSLDQEERAKLLQFVTGSSRVPLEGFGALQGVSGVTKFTIVAAHTHDSLPSAHTCFNQIDLPEYSSYEDLRKYLLIAITEGQTGFAFA